MKKIIAISILSILFSCKEKEQKVLSEFTEQDAYEIINTHFIGQLNESDADSIIYWNNRQLRSPEFEHTFIESDRILNFTEIPAPYPIFTAEYWNTEKINGIKVMEWKEYDSFFKKNDSMNLEVLWDTKFNGEYVHNVSYPIYNPETKIAVIRDYDYRPFIICGTGLDNIYYYKKNESGWSILR
ncbi:hypothetical protein ACFQZJ_18975 [Maribacter chungangensis]|uniref:Uncharacterized protein n=1 Tax=Maribacter chungangensis TaxID=1069117 RepID=A0ABW3B9J3_9FLAO